MQNRNNKEQDNKEQDNKERVNNERANNERTNNVKTSNVKTSKEKVGNEKVSNEKVSNEKVSNEKSNTQKGNTQKGNTQKGNMQKGNTQKGNTQKGNMQKGNTQKTSNEKVNIEQPNVEKIVIDKANIEKLKENKIKIIPLGGLEQIGMNITAFESEDTIIVVDCGVAFPDDEMLGIDLVIPDVSYLKENASKVKGFVITHGHEDHIGSLPYVMKEINVPIYATKLTMGLIENKLKEHNLLKTTKRKVVKQGQIITLNDFRIEFIRSNHSIADAVMLAIYSKAGTIIHTGDFKIDYTPVFGDVADLQRLSEIGKKGVLALLCDSTNVERPGYTMSESTVGKTFDSIFADNQKNRIIVATFASNVDRVQQIISSVIKYGRKVVIEGRSMINVINTASELGYIKIPENTIIDIDEMKNYPDEKITIISTGSQGEPMAALSRMAMSLHKKISISPGDLVIFSSSPIPGNEKTVTKVMNELYRKGAKVIHQDTHVSGHGYQEEIKLIHTLVKPKYLIPVHGEYKHLIKHKEIGHMLGIPKENIFIIGNGDVLQLSNEGGGAIVGKVSADPIFVDGLGVGDVGNIVLRDRQLLSKNGLIIVVVTLQRQSGIVVSGPDIISRGFVYVRESENLIDEARNVVRDALESCVNRKITDWSKMKSVLKDSLSDFIWKQTKRNPMILPIIMEV